MSLSYYSNNEAIDKGNTINNFRNIFEKYKINKPTLEEALYHIFISSDISKDDSKALTNDILMKCHNRINQVYDNIKNKFNISKEEAYTICSYTCESMIKDFSPYKILNKNMVTEDRKNGIENISKYLYILLLALRKLPKYFPDDNNKFLYRCIRSKVNLNEPNGYKIGIIKTFYAFTSTSTNPILSYKFLEKENEIKTGTIFSLGGDIWGYDISLFSFFNEKEILLEPERQFKIYKILPELNGVIHIDGTYIDTPIPLDEESTENPLKKLYYMKKNYIDSLNQGNNDG